MRSDNLILSTFLEPSLLSVLRWIEVTSRMGEVVRMFNGGAGDWCLASQEERKKTEVLNLFQFFCRKFVILHRQFANVHCFVPGP